MPIPLEQDARQDGPPAYYGATLYFPNCNIFQEPFQRLSRTTPEYLTEAVAAELEKHARLHRAAKSTPCVAHGELNDIYRTPVSATDKRLQWFMSGKIETTWDDEAGAYRIITMR